MSEYDEELGCAARLMGVTVRRAPAIFVDGPVTEQEIITIKAKAAQQTTTRTKVTTVKRVKVNMTPEEKIKARRQEREEYHKKMKELNK